MFHSLRHFSASSMLAEGVNPMAVAGHLGDRWRRCSASTRTGCATTATSRPRRSTASSLGDFADSSRTRAVRRARSPGHRLVGGESACTPDSVRDLAVRWRPSISAGGCPTALAAYPGVDGRAALPLLGLAPGGVYRAARVTPDAGALLPHRFTLTCAPAEAGAIGGLFSVALSCGSPRLGVTQHPALWSPDVPRTGHERVRTRPPGRLATATIEPPRTRIPTRGRWLRPRDRGCTGARERGGGGGIRIRLDVAAGAIDGRRADRAARTPAQMRPAAATADGSRRSCGRIRSLSSRSRRSPASPSSCRSDTVACSRRRSPSTAAPALIMAADLAAHAERRHHCAALRRRAPSNFGVFGTPERQLVFDVNDFDETLPGPWEWDVKRLAASFEVAGRDQAS